MKEYITFMTKNGRIAMVFIDNITSIIERVDNWWHVSTSDGDTLLLFANRGYIAGRLGWKYQDFIDICEPKDMTEALKLLEPEEVNVSEDEEEIATNSAKEPSEVTTN